MVEGEDLMLASGSQDGYIRLWRVTELSQALTGAESAVASQQKTEESDQLDDDMLDEFERQMTGETGGTARGGKQLSTKAHVITLGSSAGTDGAAGPRQYGINLEALLIGHEGWVTNVHWSPSLHSISSNIAVTPRLLSTAADNSMIIWAPEPRTAVWLAQHRFGEMNAKGLGLFGALWTVEGESSAGAHGRSASLSVVANAWNGGFQRWSAEVLCDSAAEQESEQWESEAAPTGHGLAVKDLAWDPAHEYLVSVR